MKLAFWNNVLVMLLIFEGLTTANNTTTITKQAGTTIITTANKMGSTVIVSSSRKRPIPTVKPLSINSVPAIYPTSNATIITTKNSSLSTSSIYNPKNTTTTTSVLKSSIVKPKPYTNNNNPLLPNYQGPLYPRLNTPIVIRNPDVKPISNLELLLDGVKYNVVGIYNKISAMVLSESSANKGVGIGKILFPIELTQIGGNQHRRAINSYNSKILTSIIEKPEMKLLLGYTGSNWKPFLFEKTEITAEGKMITHIYSNIERLFIYDIKQLHYLQTPMINW